MILLAALVALAWLGGGALAADPEADARAQAAYERAMTAYSAGRFGQAAVAFEEAYAAVSDPALLWNIGRSWEQAGELAKARDSYRNFLGQHDVDAELRVKVADALVRVGAKIQAREDAKTQAARVEQLQKEIREAESERNAELIGKLEGQLQSERDAAAAEARAAEPVHAEPAPTVHQTRQTESRGPNPVSWVAMGVGVAAVGVGTWMMLSAKSKRQLVDDAITAAKQGDAGRQMSRAEALKFESDANRNATIGVAMLGVGGALTVTGVVLAIVTRKKGEPAVAFSAFPSRHSAVVTASGRF
ncbi:MAG: tetratricopeptide repeat protein [Myxococcota bacterium]